MPDKPMTAEERARKIVDQIIGPMIETHHIPYPYTIESLKGFLLTDIVAQISEAEREAREELHTEMKEAAADLLMKSVSNAFREGFRAAREKAAGIRVALMTTKKCSYDPTSLKGLPIGMFHCPECGEMILAGVKHPDYSLANPTSVSNWRWRLAMWLLKRPQDF